ncbi:unnamed protein product [Amoebophrya sp. A120]|nr:unnamed protein product [Amoebophrya sp. A120]|eukprot:GSA120T00001860001.1
MASRSKLGALREAAGVDKDELIGNYMEGLRQSQGAGFGGSQQLVTMRPAGAEEKTRIMKLLHTIEKDVEEFIEDLEVISHNIVVLANEVKRSFTKEDEVSKVREFQVNMDQGKNYCAKVKNCLADLEKLQDQKNKASQAMTKREREYCQSVLGTSTSKFQAAVKELLAAQNTFEKEAKHRMKLALSTLYPDASMDEVATLVESDNTALLQTVMRKRSDASDDQAMQEQLMLLQEQSDAMLELEKSVLELNDLFFYLSSLVEQQARSLQSIEDNVNKTDQFVGEGVQRLALAEKHQASYDWKRKWLQTGLMILCCFGICIGLGFILMYCQPVYDCVYGTAEAGVDGATSAVSGSGGEGAKKESSFQEVLAHQEVVAAPAKVEVEPHVEVLDAPVAPYVEPPSISHRGGYLSVVRSRASLLRQRAVKMV